MKTSLPYPFKPCVLYLSVLCISSFCQAQNFKGKDGAANFTTSGTYIPNRYTTLAAPANAGSLSITVSNIGDLSGTTSFPNSINSFATASLTKGDLIMIIQVQGADITTTDDAAYGEVTAYNNTGNYELRTVYDVTGNTILLCQNLFNSYSQGGRARTEVIRVPRFSSLTVAAGVTLTGLAWDGTIGGVVAVEAASGTVINGAVSANYIGFRGGIDDKNVSSASGLPAVLLYRSTANTTATKGESIAGNAIDYNSLNGANGRGAPANGGGGGNGHNTGGGGGSNAAMNGALLPWNGTGIKDVSTPSWASAWNLESASFATDISTGGGRGGYSYGNSNQDALTLAPGSNAWGGDHRNNVGGFGGRPLDYNNNTRLFMGGGGGAGEGNNNSAGNGGNGGGIVFILSGNSILGSGTITANGQNGFDTQNSNIDAAGGAGGGGAIVAMASSTIGGISITANGGTGGNQRYLTGEAEGPGGGGGGGYISTTSTSVSRTVNGGNNGLSSSLLITEFLPNGATLGASGTIATRTFSDVYACDPAGYILSVRFISFVATLHESSVKLDWITGGQAKNSRFEIERSDDGIVFTGVSIVSVTEDGQEKSSYSFTDNLTSMNQQSFYRIKWISADNKYTYSDIRTIRRSKQSTATAMSIYPNPVANDLRITLPAAWQGKKVKLEVFDITGKLTRSFERQQASQTETIAMNELVKGFYLVKASMGSETAQQKLIKN